MTKTVLAVDDTPDNLSFLVDTLKDTYQLQVAPSGEKALSYLEHSELPDLILLDIFMPGLSGFDVLERVKNNEKTKNIPVILLSASFEKEDEQKGLLMGACGYITKPLSIPLLLEAIKKALG